MGINVSWYNEEKTIILREMIGNWTWEEFHTSQEQINGMLREVGYIVDQIIDTRNSGAIPSSALTQFRNANKDVPDNAGTRVVIGTNAFYQMMFKILSNIFPNVTDRVILAKDMDSALALIREKQAERASNA